MSPRWLRASAATCVLLVSPIGAIVTSGTGVAAPGPSNQVVPSADPIPGQYIVTLRDPDPSRVPGTAYALANRHDGAVFQTYASTIHGFAVQLSSADAEALAADPNVESVAQDAYVSASTTQTPAPSWGIDRIDQRALPTNNQYRYASDGTGVHVYILDTGIRISHDDFGGRASVGADFVGDGQGPGCEGSSNTKGGHGTHVAGTIGGATHGVAKNVTLVSVRVLNCAGSGSLSQVIAGLQWVQDNAVQPAVANMSLGAGQSDALDDAVRSAISSGVTFAIAAGNDKVNACTKSPADVAEAITVGATNSADSRDTSYSNFGPCLDLFAPGTGITSDWNTGNAATNALSGTSMATPHVTGAAAQFLSRNPSATPAVVSASIVANATPNVVTNQGTGSPRALLFEDYLAAAAPATPSLVATPGDATAHLSWSTAHDGGSPLTAFNVYRATTSGAETLVKTLPGTATAYDDGSLANGTTYYYEIGAVNANGETRSPEVSTRPSAPPAPPGAVTATPGDARVDLEWSAPLTDGGTPLLGYRVYRGTTPGGEDGTPIATRDASTTTAADTTVVNGTTYYYQVAAYTEAGETRATEVQAQPVGPPAAPTLTAVGGSPVRLSWTVPSTGGSPITSYRVYRSTTPGTETLYQTLAAGTTAYDDASVSPGATYYYQVSASSVEGEGARSAERVAVAGASVDVFGRDAMNGLRYQRITATTVGPATSLGGSATSNPAAVSDATGTAVFVRGPDGALWWRRIVDGTVSAWSSLGGYLTSDPAAYTTGSELGVFVLGGDSAVYWLRISGTVASGTPQGYQSLGGYGTSVPASAAVGSTKFVVVRGSNGAVFFQRFSGTFPSGGWQNLGGYITNDPSVTADAFSGGGVTVLARGADYSEFRQHVSTSGAGGGWLALGGNVTSSAAVAFDGTNVVAFVRGADSSLFYQRFTSVSTGTGWLPLGGVGTSDPKATFDGDAVRVVVRSSDNGYYWQIPGVVGWTPLGGTYTSNPAITRAN